MNEMVCELFFWSRVRTPVCEPWSQGIRFFSPPEQRCCWTCEHPPTVTKACSQDSAPGQHPSLLPASVVFSLAAHGGEV